MKLITKLVLLAPLLTACSATMSNDTTTLIALPTTVIPIIDTIPSGDTSFTLEQIAFIDDVYFFYGGVPSIGDEELVQIGELWCGLMTDGMSADDVIGRINEGSSDNDEAKLHYSIIEAGGENLCRDQFAKVEEIALRPLMP